MTAGLKNEPDGKHAPAAMYSAVHAHGGCFDLALCCGLTSHWWFPHSKKTGLGDVLYLNADVWIENALERGKWSERQSDHKESEPGLL